MATALLDLRSNTQAGSPGALNAGPGLFLENGRIWLGPWEWNALQGGWDIPLTIGPLTGTYVDLGDDPLARMTTFARNSLADRLGIARGDLPDSSLADLLAHYVLGTLADATGVNRVKPWLIAPNALTFKLPGFGPLLSDSFDPQHPNFQATLEVRREDYRRQRAEGQLLAVLRRWTGFDMLQYFGRTGDDLIPLLLPDEHQEDGWEDPQTSITEDGSSVANFTQDAGSWDSDGSQIRGLNSDEVASVLRHNTALSGDAHYCEAFLDAPGGSFDIGVAVRKAASATLTYYAGGGGSDGNWAIWKVVAGTKTRIAFAAGYTDQYYHRLTVGDTGANDLLLEADTTPTPTTDRVSVTDMAITGNLAIGLYGLDNFGTRLYDSLAAADLAAGGADVRKEVSQAYLRING